MSNRKEQYKKSQKKRREIMKEQGKVPLSDYVLEETKNKLVKLQKANGYRRIGDAVDKALKDLEI
jgi:transcriptional accessory protein Tex/SPT6